jgi:hypothetical protein
MPLLENPAFDQIRKRWANASRMRTFYAEMKKSISEALEKRRQKLMLQEKNNSYNESMLSPQQNDDGVTMIDTMTVKEEEVELGDVELRLEKTIS